MDMAAPVGAVVEGRNGRLFLGRQDGFDLGRFTDGSALPPSLLEQWRATLVRRGRELSALGIPYVFMIAPDAPAVHLDDLPDSYPGPYRTPAQVFLDAMGEVPGVTFVYPVTALRQARGGLDVYQRTDSHWTMFGSGVAYRELMGTVAKFVPCRVVPSSAVRFTFRSSFGDLGAHMDPERRCDIPVAAFDGPEPGRAPDYWGPQRQVATRTSMAGVPASRALAFRDSFMTDLAPYLARSFSDLMMLGTTTRLLLDAVNDFRPDIVISEVAERRLVAFESDHQPHRYRWLYLSDHSTQVGRTALRALNLLAGGDAAGAAATIRAEDASRMMSDHSYTAAVIFEAAGDPAAAAPFADAALAADGRDTGALALSTRLRLAGGRVKEAASLAAKAVEIAPWNGALCELYVYALMLDGQVKAAAAAAEGALRRVQDLANLWYWAAVAQDASERIVEAERSISNARILDPCNPTYATLSERIKSRLPL